MDVRVSCIESLNQVIVDSRVLVTVTKKSLKIPKG